MTAAVRSPTPARHGGRWRVVAVGAVLVAIALAVLGSSRGVSAHAKLVRAKPAPGSTVTAAPATIRAWFSDELDVGRKGDGDKAWIEIELARSSHITAIGFWTRTMGSTA